MNFEIFNSGIRTIEQVIQNNNGGFIDYNDNSTAMSPVTLLADVWTDVPNNGLGASTNEQYRPIGITNLLDTATGYINPTELALGDAILIRNDITVTQNINESRLEFRYVLGSGAGEYTLEKSLDTLNAGAGIVVPYRFSLNTDYIYMGDANTRDNPIKIQVKLSSDGTLINNGSVIQVLRQNIN